MNNTDTTNFLKQLIITSIFSILGFLMVRSINSVDHSVGEATKSINELNKQMGALVAEVAYQRRDIDRHELEIRSLKKYIIDDKN